MTIKLHKGNRCVVLSEGKDDEFWMGIKKARTVLQPDNLTALRAFVAEEEAREKAEKKKVETPAPEVQAAAPTVDLAKELETLRAQIAALKAPVVQPKEKPAGRFAGK